MKWKSDTQSSSSWAMFNDSWLGVRDIAEDVDEVDAMLAIPFCYDCDELSRLSLVRVSEVRHFLVCYYIW